MTVDKQQPMVHYRVRWKPSGHHPGLVKGRAAGTGDQLRSLVLLRDHPDPRRLDLRASVRDPFQRLYVRDFNLNAALNVIVLLDASASMHYQGEVNRLDVAREIAAHLAMSAYRSGDAFGLYAAHQHVLSQTMLPPKLNRSAWWWVRQHLANMTLQGASVKGLLSAARILPKQRSLVLIISDFRWPTADLVQLFKCLSHHDVVPIVLQDPQEAMHMPRRGFTTVKDMETGSTRFVWMRDALIRQVIQKRQAHVALVDEIGRRYGHLSFLVRGHFSSAALTHYFIRRQR